MFFKDKANVFFSLLSALIIILLYILFLGNVMEQGFESTLGFSDDRIRVAMAAMIMSGMVAITTVSACLGALGIAVIDKKDTGKDFLTSPIPRWKIAFGYMSGAAVVGIIMGIIALVLVLGYLLSLGGAMPSPADFALLLLTIVLATLCGNAMMYVICLFIKTENAYSAFTAIVGVLLGFVMGVYMPIGTFPPAVQWFSRLFPMSHAASMFRQILTRDHLAALFQGAPVGMAEDFEVTYGVVFQFGDYTTDFWFSALYLLAWTAIFFIIGVLLLRKQKLK